MTPKPLAVFTADVPDDTVEDERDIVLFGGRNIAEAIGQIATDFGCASSGLLYEGEKGWSLEIKYKGQAYAGLVSSFHPQFFLTFYSPVFGGRLNPSDFADFWAAMDAALRDDGRIHDLKWYEVKDAPAPWEGLPAHEGPAPREPKLRSERLRLAQRAKRGLKPGGCLLPLASVCAVLIGGMEMTSGVVALLAHDLRWSQLLMGSLMFLAGGLGVWMVYRRSRDA